MDTNGFEFDLNPHTDNMGVEITQSWHIDYLTITRWGNNLKELFEVWFSGELGNLLDQEHGGRFYRQTYRALLGITLRSDPINNDGDRETLEVPGQACQIIGFERLKRFILYLYSLPEKVRVNRIDIAFNKCSFTVKDIYNSILNDEVRSLFKRYTLRYYENLYEKDELGNTGTSGITIGGRSSTRYLRIYDKHGYTRVEVEFKDEKADQVAVDVFFANDDKESLRYAVGHLKDYFEVKNQLWDEFYNNLDRLYSKLPKDVKEMSIEGVKRWFENQIAGSFYILSNVVKDEEMDYFKNLYKLGMLKAIRNKGKVRNLINVLGIENSN